MVTFHPKMSYLIKTSVCSNHTSCAETKRSYNVSMITRDIT